MGEFSGKWCILIGFKAENLHEISPVVRKLKEEYPDQKWNIMNSKFEVYDFILCGFADDRDHAHKAGMAVVKKHMPSHLNCLYWIKEIGLLKYNVKTNRKED